MVLATGIVVLRLALHLITGWAEPQETFRWFARHAAFGERTVFVAPRASAVRADGSRPGASQRAC